VSSTCSLDDLQEMNTQWKGCHHTPINFIFKTPKQIFMKFTIGSWC